MTVIFSTHVIHHAERLCEGVAIIAGGKVPYAGSVEAARDRIPAQVRLETRAREGAWLAALPKDPRRNGDFFQFALPESGIEPLLRQLIEGAFLPLRCEVSCTDGLVLTIHLHADADGEEMTVTGVRLSALPDMRAIADLVVQIREERRLLGLKKERMLRA